MANDADAPNSTDRGVLGNNATLASSSYSSYPLSSMHPVHAEHTLRTSEDQRMPQRGSAGASSSRSNIHNANSARPASACENDHPSRVYVRVAGEGSSGSASPGAGGGGSRGYSDRFIPCRTASNLVGMPLLDGPNNAGGQASPSSEREDAAAAYWQLLRTEYLGEPGTVSSPYQRRQPASSHETTPISSNMLVYI